MQLYVYAIRQRMYVYINLYYNNLANMRGTLRKVCGTTFPKSEKTEALGVKTPTPGFFHSCIITVAAEVEGG